MDDLDKRLEVATRKRDALAAECRHIEGKLEAARASLETLEAECRAKGVEPDQIDAAIEKLERAYTKLVEQLEQDVATAETALNPFLKE